MEKVLSIIFLLIIDFCVYYWWDQKLGIDGVEWLVVFGGLVTLHISYLMRTEIGEE